MKKSLIAIIMLFVSIASFAQKFSPDQVAGAWQMDSCSTTNKSEK